MTTIRRQARVSFTYTILGEQGDILERSDLPMQYVHGAGSELLPKLERALEGKRVGDKIEVWLSPEEGFGPRRPELTFTDALENVPPQFRYLGAVIEMQNDRGEARQFTVTQINASTLTIDGNHPFAGKRLRYLVEITAIESPHGYH